MKRTNANEILGLAPDCARRRAAHAGAGRAAGAQPQLRVIPVRGEVGRAGTWQVLGQPFRVVALPVGWHVVATSDPGRRLLARNDLLGRPFPTRAAALRELCAALGT